MNLLGKLVCAGAFLFLLQAAQAFAQFEVNPDHFDNMVKQAPPKPSVASNPKAARQHLGTGALPSQQSLAPNSEAQRARTSSSENVQATTVQRRGHARKVPRDSRALDKVQPQHQTDQVAQVRRE